MAYKNPHPVLDDDRVQLNAVDSAGPDIADYTRNEEVYFAFIDVLGFKQTFDENRENPGQEFAQKYATTFRYYSHLINKSKFIDSETQNGCGAGQTSDSLYFYTTRLDYLVNFIYLYIHFSLYAMSEGVFFRGGIAKGSLFVNRPYQFYGDSVIKAYLLESSIAKYPRLALDQSTYFDLQNTKAKENTKDEKGRYYILPFAKMSISDFLQTVGIDESDIRHIDKQTWEKIGEEIKRNKARFEFEERNFQKYNYLLSEFENTGYPYE